MGFQDLLYRRPLFMSSPSKHQEVFGVALAQDAERCLKPALQIQLLCC